MLKNIENMNYYQLSNLIHLCNIEDNDIKKVLLNRMNQLTKISSSYEQYQNDLNLILSVFNESFINDEYERCIEILTSAYEKFKYVDLLYYLGIVYYEMHDFNNSIELFRRYLMFGGYLKLDNVFYYLSMCYKDNEYESNNFLKLSKKYKKLYGI